ncbi:3,4-dihydroxy-2-butanone-4-phosphate synthase [Seohaeicola nanhaiensis]|uniref:3,4-dihydroxy-2-butanone 4-phosphate synthase n=1 Tax=Seohaeicola nanhaiensis TaxID=1387282 RepID=A0ABV9KMH7_9RHOB
METNVQSSFKTAVEALAAGRCVFIHGESGARRAAVMVVAATHCDAPGVNLLAKHARGLVCLAMTGEQAARLELRMQPRRNMASGQTGFTVSIEAARGVSTGISAEDRARTIAAAIDPASGPRALHTPGHVFPYVVADGGTLLKPMLPEAALDLARLSGCGPFAVFSDVLDDEGELADIGHFQALAESLDCAVLDIKDLILARRRTEKMVERTHATSADTEEGGIFAVQLYRNRLSGAEHIALIKGNLSAATGAVPVRVHSLNITDDILRWRNFGPSDHVGRYLRAVDALGCGVIILIRESYDTTLTERFVARERQASTGYGFTELTDFGIPAQILADLGVRQIELLSESEGQYGNLAGFGISCVGTRPVSDAG